MWMVFLPCMMENPDLGIQKIEPDASVFTGKEGMMQKVQNCSKEGQRAV